jgi:hypothetical protein
LDGLRSLFGPGQHRQKNRSQNRNDGDNHEQFDQSESPPGLAEIKIREDFFANRFAAFKHKLAHAAGNIGTILSLAREPVRVDDESVFSRIAVTGKHFLQKLFTFSHNSQNRNPPDTPPAFKGAKTHGFSNYFSLRFNDSFRIFAFAIEKTPVLRIMLTPCGCAIHNSTTDASFTAGWLWSRWPCICRLSTMVLLNMMTSNM